MNPANFQGIDDYHIKVVSDNGDGTETLRTVEQWKKDCLFGLSAEVRIDERLLTK